MPAGWEVLITIRREGVKAGNDNKKERLLQINIDLLFIGILLYLSPELKMAEFY